MFETKLMKNGNQKRYLSSSYFIFQIRSRRLFIMKEMV